MKNIMINSIFFKYRDSQCVELRIELIEQLPNPPIIKISMSGDTMDENKIKELQQHIEKYNRQFAGLDIKEQINAIKTECMRKLRCTESDPEYRFCSYEKPLRSSFKTRECDVSIRISCNGNCTANEVEITKTPQSPDSPDKIFIGNNSILFNRVIPVSHFYMNAKNLLDEVENAVKKALN
jgi:hypothetical protein